MLQRLKITLIGSGLLAGYLWSGAVTKLWIAARTAGQPAYGVSGVLQRPMRGYPRAGANVPLFRAMVPYGPLSAGMLLGPTTGPFLRGLGLGVDPESPDYDARCRSALEGVAARPGLNPWRNHARLELAHLVARPPSLNQRAYLQGTPDIDSPSWVTLGLIDNERWWVTRQTAGLDPARARELCDAILQDDPDRLVMGDVLQLQASLAGEQWDFAARDALLRDLIESSPSSPHAQPALQELAVRMADQGRVSEAAGLARRLLRQLTPQERVRLVPALVPLLSAAEGASAARALLQSALREAELLARDMGGRRLSMADPRTPLREALQQLPARPTPPPVVPPAAGPVFPVRSRLLAGNKALPGVSVALVPMQVMTRHIPHPVAAGLMSPRPSGVFPEPEDKGSRRRGKMGEPAWQLTNLGATLRLSPALVTRSDAEGRLTWSAVPPGLYGVVLRAGTWQLPRGGRELAVTPLTSPIAIQGPGAVVPDLHLHAAVRATPVAGDRLPPGLRWRPVKGASSYRVSLSALPLSAGGGFDQAHGLASPALDPEVVWWREGVRDTSLRLTPEHFTGPADDPQRNGLQARTSYRWCIEARDAAGRTIATTETLAPRATLQFPAWTALRPAAHGGGQPVAVAPHAPTSLIRTYYENDRQKFSSPFLDYLAPDEEAAVVASARPALYPTSVTPGHGLPTRAALATAVSPSPSGIVPGPPASSGSLPPGFRPPFPVGMRPEPGDAFPPGLAGAPPRLPAPPSGAQPGVPRAAMAGVTPRPGAGEAPQTVSVTTVSVTLEEFNRAGPTRWQADRELASPTASAGLAVSEPLVLTARETALPLPAGPGRLSLRLSTLAAEATAVLLDPRGQAVRLRLHPDPRTRTLAAPFSPGDWKLKALEVRPTAGEVQLLSLIVSVPAGPGLYARAWQEETIAWIEVTNLGAAPQSVAVSTDGGASTATLDLAPAGRARLPFVGTPAAAITVHSGKSRLETPIRGRATEQ